MKKIFNQIIVINPKIAMTQNQPTVKLSKFLTYILGHRPDEFGLVLDKNGFIKIKELLKAVNEENGWKHIRNSNIDEIIITLPHPPIEIKHNMARAVNRDHIPIHQPAPDPPKLLYTCTRQKAYPYAAQKGIYPSRYQQVVLSHDRSISERMGKRVDPKPIVLTVQVQKAIRNGVVFHQAGSIFLADFIPVGCFTGPPLPKPKTDSQQQDIPEERPVTQRPGSFIVDLNRDKNSKKSFGRNKREKEPSWKKNRKRIKNQKQKMWPT